MPTVTTRQHVYANRDINVSAIFINLTDDLAQCSWRERFPICVTNLIRYLEVSRQRQEGMQIALTVRNISRLPLLSYVIHFNGISNSLSVIFRDNIFLLQVQNIIRV